MISTPADTITACINAIGTAVPDHDMHGKFLQFAPMILEDDRKVRLLERMAAKSGIAHRYSVLAPHPDTGRIDSAGFYRRGAFPDTRQRMRLFEEHALPLAIRAIDDLGVDAARSATHLVLSCCTGFTGPGTDLQIAQAVGLRDDVERTVVGFMGCSAALNALKLARHQVRSDPAARVLMINLELCTLHFRETTDTEEMLSYLIFADGCAASLITAEHHGLALDSFRSTVIPDSSGHITWQIGEAGFVMHLSGALPAAVGRTVAAMLPQLLGGRAPTEIPLWAVHPGGRSILDAVERGVGNAMDLRASRDILRQYGNMSSPTIMFVMQRFLSDPHAIGEGCMLAFGPGITVESARFRKLA